MVRVDSIRSPRGRVHDPGLNPVPAPLGYVLKRDVSVVRHRYRAHRHLSNVVRVDPLEPTPKYSQRMTRARQRPKRRNHPLYIRPIPDFL